MARRSYTAAQKTEALELYASHGPSVVQTRLGIPKGTVTGWARTNGVQTVRNENLGAAIEAHSIDMAKAKAQLAVALMADIERIRAQLWEACTEQKLMTVTTSLGHSEIEVGEIDRDRPTFAEQKAIMTTLAIAVDKVQILTGDVTERIEHRHTDQLDREIERLLEATS